MKWITTIFFLCSCFAHTQAQVDHWEMLVNYNDNWKYQEGQSSIGSNWIELAYDEQSWDSGPGSIGYGDGDDNTVIDMATSIYMRRVFEIVDLNAVERLIFHADYDDGFVAYLNGQEIARSNVLGDQPSSDTWATSLHEAQVYSGGTPEHFFLSLGDWEGVLNEGLNVLSIQTHNYEGTASSDLTTSYWLSAGLNDQSGNYNETPDWFSMIEFSSTLPIIKVSTGGFEIPDEPSIGATMGIIWNGVGQLNSSLAEPNEWFGNVSIEKRGQSSLALFPKVGYAIETKDDMGNDLDVSFLGFPEEEDWILHGPYSDKTLMRNKLAMKIATDMGQYASRTRFVELMINEEYIGVYLLMERIKQDKNRVDIANLKPEDISGDELTGGYVFKVDKGQVDWESKYNMINSNQKLSFQFVSPNRSSIVVEQKEYIKTFVDSVERALQNPLIEYGGKSFDEYIDIQSFAQHFIHSELAKDIDAYRISTYLHKDKDSNGGLLHIGPVWDFNLAFGNADYCNAQTSWSWVYDINCGNGNPFWWNKLVSNQQFANEVNCLWSEYRQTFLHLDSLNLYIDSQVELLEPVVERNFTRWPILDEYIWPNPVVTGSYEGEIEHMKSTLESRIAWMDDNMIGQCLSTEIESEVEAVNFEVFPNPAAEYLIVNCRSNSSFEATMEIFDQVGHHVMTSEKLRIIAGNNQFPLDIISLKPGVYFYQFTNNGDSIEQNSFVKM